MFARTHTFLRTASVLAALAVGSSAHAVPVSFMDLGVIGKAGSFTFDTNGSNFDTELGLWNEEGRILGRNDDGGIGLQSRLTRTLARGVYFLGVSEFNSRFRRNFRNTGTGFEPGETEDIVLNLDGSQLALFQGASDQLDQETAFFRVEVEHVPTPGGMSLAGAGLAFFGVTLGRKKLAKKG